MDKNHRNEKPQEARTRPLLPQQIGKLIEGYSIVAASCGSPKYESIHCGYQAFAPHYSEELLARKPDGIDTNQVLVDLEQSSPNYRSLDDCAKQKAQWLALSAPKALASLQRR
jgi:hypothetical protein